MQKALIVKNIGKPIVLIDRAIPEPGEGQVLIKITATMSKSLEIPLGSSKVLDAHACYIVLPHDTYGRDAGLFISHKLPYILGTNLAGVV